MQARDLTAVEAAALGAQIAQNSTPSLVTVVDDLIRWSEGESTDIQTLRALVAALRRARG